MTEKVQIEERLGIALSSGRLSWGSMDHLLVSALGAASLSERMADAIFRLRYANDVSAYHDALGALTDMARAIGTRKNWRAKRSKLRAMARAVLEYWLCDVCPSCMGLGRQKILGAPMLSAELCGYCMGTGRRPVPWANGGSQKKKQPKATDAQEDAKRHDELLAELQRAERNARQLVARQLREAPA